jgi:hypothetical protein
LVEQPIRNRQVIGSSPIVGSSFLSEPGAYHGAQRIDVRISLTLEQRRKQVSA